MKIYVKPFEKIIYGHNLLNGNVIDLESTTETVTDIADIYEDYTVSVKRTIEIDGAMVQATDEEGTLLYDEETHQRLKDCVVEFDVTDENFLSRSIEEMLTSTYWIGNFGIQRDYGEVTDKSKAYTILKENEELKQSIEDMQMIISDLMLGGL